MSIARAQDRLQLPETLRAQLGDFRRRVWTIKTVEAAGAAAFGVVVAFLLMFALDRVWETPGWLRLALFVGGAIGIAHAPWALYRWVWRNRRLEQLARLLSRREPRIGDQLLGVIELSRSDSEQARSRRLCEAAIRQVAEDAETRDFRAAVPTPRHRFWAWMVAVPALLVLGLFAIVPAAAANAWARLLLPWKDVPRYTFAALEPLPRQLVVAHGEPFTVAARLSESTAWRPGRGIARLSQQPAVAARLKDGRYEFAMPAQIDPGWLDIRIGDSSHRVRVEPTLRPELTAIVAEVALPSYLERPKPTRRDVRGGAIAIVKGGRARFDATASRTLASAEINGRAQVPSGATITSPEIRVDGPRKVEFRWRDTFGLAGKEPFTLTINGHDDEAPTLTCEGLPRRKVVLDTEQLGFKVHASDDFGIKRVGLEWHGTGDPTVKSPALGERVLAAGGPEKDSLEVAGTFAARSLGIEPQPIDVRVFVEDYLPGRPRVYSPTYTLYVLSPEQHAIWLTEQLSKWHRKSLEVRDRELQLYETNKELRALAAEELDRPETRRRLENQAVAERANGRRLTNLVTDGEELVQQAMRNPEFGVGHLEKWAEMLQILKDISNNRMPSVADLLKQASQAPAVAANAPSKRSPMAGMVRDTRTGQAGGPQDPKKGQTPAVPMVVDRESSQQPLGKGSDSEPPPSKGGSPSLRLPTTTIASPGKESQSCPVEQKVEEAVVQQRDLLAEFEKIADELNKILANLEGSTLVKRLKAASRLQYKISGRIGDQLANSFGLAEPRVGPGAKKVFGEMAEQEAKGTIDVSNIMDDMQAYFERRRLMQFKNVLDEMKTTDVIGALRQLGDDLKKENGVSIAQCEFWSDTLDRWADDLVDPLSGGT